MTAFRRWALNRADILLGILSLVLLTTVVGLLIGSTIGLQYLPADPEIRKGVSAAILAGWVTISLACVGGAIKVTAARQSLISLLSSEIKAIQFGLTRMHMFGFWSFVYNNPGVGAAGFADVPREENYFEIFHSVSSNLGNLHPRVVEAIVRFYTYLKMSRDAAGALKTWEQQTDQGIRKLHVSYVVNILGLSMLWGFVALWFMGFKANENEINFLQELKESYDSVLGPLEFSTLWKGHSRREALEMFFEGSVVEDPSGGLISIISNK